ncbi:GNAT family N-acetyltransferase [Actinokineospora sp. UTMC 2448]|uniref:GNAT family N-acetyltransferase n=1 Tax=Actinokineospora sp. UTMC 2448 TaxID=2268449 RepID=UPI002163FFC7|nr:GNAT family protein [Actinokineospora sp. UTMC 2448]UVS76593.1 Putative ribosomal N-acetyltransferase YdaF [Actinokineospora sp. UTMC 2448]
MDLQPTLVGEHVRLAPTTMADSPGLYAAGADRSVWTWLGKRYPESQADMDAQVAEAIADPTRFPFTQFAASGEIAGTTSYYEVDAKHRGIYIGHTWIGAPWQRTALNTEAKLLLMTHAFDTLGALRVGWHTDIRNERSQRAIERLGAQREGVLRHHRFRPDGTIRDTVVYSVTVEEWPAVRDGLAARLSAGSPLRRARA